MKVKIYGYLVNCSNFQLRKNFSLTELANNKGSSLQPQYIIDSNVDTFLNMLQEFRDWYNKEMTITSSYRQPQYNKSVGGDSRSAHLHATAVDWWIPGHTDAQRTNVRNKWAEICGAHGVVGAINFYTHGYHLEAFSDKWYGSKNFALRDYRGKTGDW